MEREKLIALVTAGQKGDADALNGLFDAFYNDVYYFALKTVKDPDRACDVTQDTFVKVIEHIGDLQEPAAFVPWMKQITYRECIRHTPQSKEVLVDMDADGNSIFDIAAEDRAEFIPDAALDQQEFRKTILDMLDTLSAEQRAATMLYYYDELSVKQIAQIQNVSEGTVKSRLNYARKSIKASVEHYEKKHGVRLHSIALLPLLGWLFATSRTQMPAAGVLAASGAVEAAAATAVGSAAASGAAATATGSVAAGSAVATATATGSAAAGGAATAAGVSLTAKIIAAVTAAAVLTTSGVTVAVRSNRAPKPTIPPTEPGSAYVETLEDPTEQPSTEEITEAPTEQTTESTEPPTEPPTEAPTESPTESPTEPPTEVPTESPTEPPTEAPTEPPTEVPTEPAAQGEQIPDGCRYITAAGATMEAGQHMPETPSAGDAFITPDYTYMYEYYLSLYTWQAGGYGWGVGVNDMTKSSYSALRSAICGQPVTVLNYTFYECSNMTTAPAIPSTVTSLFCTFSFCTSLTEAPAIPSGVSTMANTFANCYSLQTAPTIPAGVSFMTYTFLNCTSLTGEVVIHADPSGNYQDCFSGTVNPITLSGSSTMLEELAATATDGNVTVS